MFTQCGVNGNCSGASSPVRNHGARAGGEARRGCAKVEYPASPCALRWNCSHMAVAMPGQSRQTSDFSILTGAGLPLGTAPTIVSGKKEKWSHASPTWWSTSTFYDKMSDLVAKGRAVDIFCCNKLLKYGLDEQAVGWSENWLKDWAHRVADQWQKI